MEACISDWFLIIKRYGFHKGSSGRGVTAVEAIKVDYRNVFYVGRCHRYVFNILYRGNYSYCLYITARH